MTFDCAVALQVMSAVAQLSDLCASAKRTMPLHIVAKARGPLLEKFTTRLQRRRASLAGRDSPVILSTDILPMEELDGGFIAQCSMQPKLASVVKVCPVTLAHKVCLCL